MDVAPRPCNAKTLLVPPLTMVKKHNKRKDANRKNGKSKFRKNDTEMRSEEVQRQSPRDPIVALPDIVASPKYTVTRRFINNAAACSGSLLLSDLINQFMVATSSTVGITYIRALRIKKLRLLSPVQTQGTSVKIVFTPNGVDSSDNNFNSLPLTYVDTSASIDVPAYLAFKPAIDTPLGSWHYALALNTSEALASIQCPQGTTMDIQFEFILNDQNIASNYTNTIAAATAGTLYSRALITVFAPVVFNFI
jgi:hypothetical protein